MNEENAGLGVAPSAPGRFRRWLDRLRGRPVIYDLAPYLRVLARIEQFGQPLHSATDGALRQQALQLRRRVREEGCPPGELLPEAFALVRESSARVLGLRPFEVQLIGGMALFEGRLVEMQTGEGKTLVAVLPAFLEALAGCGVHVLTFNDYLARRDADWMGPLYYWLGLQVGCVQEGMDPEARRRAYRADVTYLTAREAGFDHLRDGLCTEAGQQVHRPFRLAIVDEADSILIDEARIPLVIAARQGERCSGPAGLAGLVRNLSRGVDYQTDIHQRELFFTEEGLARVEQQLGCGNLHEPEHAATLTALHLALHAEVLLRRDVDYLVREGRIELVDEFTGRVVRDRHWPDGLQAAVEAKEGLQQDHEGLILGSLTLQHFLQLYPRRCGMTATARPEEEEFSERYGMAVVALPPHRPCVRQDHPDLVFTHRAAKLQALVEEVVRVHGAGRPVLVGTASVRESEELAGLLRAAGVACQVLNARTGELEAEARIVAEAGTPGAVTISTNLAGRGTDIKLGGAGEREQVCRLGGLYVIGTQRHESRRIDLQLRGRAGRQGDPGESRSFLCLEDELIQRYDMDGLLPAQRRQPREGPISDPQVAYRIAWGQRVVEGQNREIRRTLWRYSTLVEQQRRLVRARRDEVLTSTGPERRLELQCIDRLWAEHLGRIDDLREGIHLVRLGGANPLEEFVRQADRAFQELLTRLEDELETAREQAASAGGPPADGRPSATWTYLVEDDPFERNLTSLLTGHSIGLSVGAALLGPIYLAGAVYQRWFSRKPQPERPPGSG